MLLKLNCYMLDSLGKLTRVYSRPASTQALQMLLPIGTAIFQLFEPELTGQETHKVGQSQVWLWASGSCIDSGEPRRRSIARTRRNAG